MKQTEKPKQWKWDVACIVVLLALGLSAFFFGKACQTVGKTVTVRLDGTLCARYSLSQDGEYVLNGGTNTLVIENGGAYVKNCSCPDKLCEKTGTVRYGGESITCLPNRLQIAVEASDGTDAVTK